MNLETTPTYAFDFATGLATTGMVARSTANLNNGYPQHFRYWLNERGLTRGTLTRLNSPLADLLDVSTAVYIADRLSLREVPGDRRRPHDRWHRRIHLTVPVRDPVAWNSADIVQLLKRLLLFLTDDVWTFEFVLRQMNPRLAETEMSLIQLSIRQPSVILNSGGLDSLTGLAKLLLSDVSDTIFPVTVVTSARIRNTSELIVERLRRREDTSAQIAPLQLRVGISGLGRTRDDVDPSQRARGMLFHATGIVAGSLVGAERIYVCENGIGAISLPMTVDHWGSRATKSMHPKTLLMMSQLATHILQKSIAIDNMGLFQTKGMLLRALAGKHFGSALNATISCDQLTYKRLDLACGHCSSCILRRVSLLAANISNQVDGEVAEYETDWLDRTLNWNRSNSIHMSGMRIQVEHLRQCLNEGSEYVDIDRGFPDILDVFSLASHFGMEESSLRMKVSKLYRSYIEEFDAFVAMIDRPGWGREAASIRFPSPIQQPTTRHMLDETRSHQRRAGETWIKISLPL